MVTFIKSIVQLIDNINEYVGKKISWLTTILVILICVDVTARYTFNFSIAALFELEANLFAAIFLIGAGYTLKSDRHVRVDVFYAKFSNKKKAWINFLGSLFFLLPFSIIVIKAGIPYVKTSLAFNEGSADPNGLPAKYIVKSLIVIGFSFLLLQCVSMLFSSLLTIVEKEKDSNI